MPREKSIRAGIDYEEFTTPRAALEHARAVGCKAVRLGGRYLVLSEADAIRLEVAGTYFAYLGDHCGKIMTVPVNG